MNIQHSSQSDEWGTPSWIMDLVRKVINPIELDPCSTSQWNLTVQAERFLEKAYHDALTIPWCYKPSSIFINPPGGKIGNLSFSSLFWGRLCHHRRLGLVKHAIWMGFSLEQLSISQSYDEDVMANYPICIPRKRIQFDSYPGVSERAPSHSNFILYMPGSLNLTNTFIEVFQAIGAVKR